MNVLEKAESLKAELDALRPLDAEAKARIMQKFRLDWNYHSNNLVCIKVFISSET